MSKKLLTPGAVCAQYVTCGKPNCRCKRGIKHGAYWYLFWREDGRLKKRYVKRQDLDRVRRACAAYRQEKKQQRDAIHLFQQVSQVLRARGL